MAPVQGLDAHRNYKLGKAKAREDSRNLKFKRLLRELVRTDLPDHYDFDSTHPGIPIPMFANDEYGDCVIAARAHQTLRFEYVEQNRLIAITDQEVLNQYLAETGGLDEGLVMLDSLVSWRNIGWRVVAEQLFIRAFAQANPLSLQEFKQAIYLDLGLQIGLALPISAQSQFEQGQLWDVASGPPAQVNSWGGHCVFVCGYTESGPVCITWGRKQQMSWAFLNKYCDEAYVVFDALNIKKLKKNLKLELLSSFLKTQPSKA